MNITKLKASIDEKHKKNRSTEFTPGGIQKTPDAYTWEEILEYKEEYNKIQLIYQTFEQFVPIFPLLGILGTVAGLIQQLDHIDQMRDALAVSMSTTFLGLIAAVIALMFGIVLGSIAALRRNKIIDRIIMIITTAFVSMPSFIMGSLLLIAFAINLKWFPANGASKNGLVLPITTLSLYPMAYITRLTKTSMLDALNQDYVRTARSKGLKKNECFLHLITKTKLKQV